MEHMSNIILNDKKTIRAWALFDWANSAYALVISTAIFPVYFIQYSPAHIDFLGYPMSNSSLYSFAVSFSYIFIALLSPLLSGVADFSGKRLYFLKIFTLLGSLSCIALYFFKGEPQLWLGTAAFILATIGFSGSLVFYDSFLPIIVTEDNYNKVSAKGFTYGYIGSVILLIFILVMILKPEFFGIKDVQFSSRLGFVLVGVWWVGFAQYTFKHLPKDRLGKLSAKTLLNGYKEITKVFALLKDLPNIKWFLLAFFWYSAGVQTVIYLATIFAEKELGFEVGELIGIVLILQIVAIGGAYLFSAIGNIKGNKFAIGLMIIIWILICLGAFMTYSKPFFYVLAASVGMVMGGIQSLSRATYAKLVPSKNQDVTSFFSFYDVVYKTAIVSGTFIFGMVESITHDMRNSVLALAFCFVFGFIFLFRTAID